MIVSRGLSRHRNGHRFNYILHMVLLILRNGRRHQRWGVVIVALVLLLSNRTQLPPPFRVQERPL